VDPSQLGSGRDLGGVLTVDVNGHCFGVDLVQAHDRSPHLPTAAEWRYKERYSFSRIPKFDYQPGARLTLKVMNGFPHRQSNWSDGARQSIEGVLAEVLQEIELRAERAERDRLEVQHAEGGGLLSDRLGQALQLQFTEAARSQSRDGIQRVVLAVPAQGRERIGSPGVEDLDRAEDPPVRGPYGLAPYRDRDAVSVLVMHEDIGLARLAVSMTSPIRRLGIACRTTKMS
jgi:hypothetical protein